MLIKNLCTTVQVILSFPFITRPHYFMEGLKFNFSIMLFIHLLIIYTNTLTVSPENRIPLRVRSFSRVVNPSPTARPRASRFSFYKLHRTVNYGFLTRYIIFWMWKIPNNTWTGESTDLTQQYSWVWKILKRLTAFITSISTKFLFSRFPLCNTWIIVRYPRQKTIGVGFYLRFPIV